MRHIQSLLSMLAAATVGAALVAGGRELGAQHAALAAAPTATAAASAACDSGRAVEVSGAATVNVTPDRVQITLGVESNAATPEAVQNSNLATSQSVIKALRELGVAPKDISTDYYAVEPIYDSYSALEIKGYRINNLIAVTLNDASKTSALLVAALRAGANRVVEVQFYTSELRRHRDEARALAMRAAAEKAQALAGAAGAQTGCVLSIREQSWSSYTGWWGRGQAQMAQNVVQNADPGGGQPAADTPIGLGKIAVRAEVSVTYSLR